MSDVTEADAATRAQILAVEDRRIAALLAVDVETLADLYDDTLVHIHAPGLVHTKAQLLEHVATRQAYHGIERGDLTIRVVGDDVAVVTGRIVNLLGSPDGVDRVLAGPVTQVLHRGDDGAWRFVSFQMTPDGEQVWGALPSELAAGSENDDTSTTGGEER